MKPYQHLLLSWFAICTLGVCLQASGDAAPRAEEWSQQTVLSPLGIASNHPDVVVDATGRVHVLWVEKLDWSSACSYDTIMYAAIVDGNWPEPQDILLSPGSRCTTEPAIALGPHDGRLHAVWSDLHQIYYSSAPASEAISAKAWLQPVVVEPTNARRPDIVVDDGNRIHVAYYRADPEWEILYTQSDDGGFEWSVPQRIHVALPDHIVESVELAVDDHGRVHLVWINELVAEGMSRGGAVFYARSTDGGEAWERPLVVDQKDARYAPDYGAGEIAVETWGENEVHLVWAGAPQGNRWHQWSSDGGETWHASQLVAPVDVLGGNGLRNFNGGLGLAVDSVGRVHLLTSGLYLIHIAWEDGQWSNLDIVLPYNPYWPRLVIGEGNKLYAVGAFLGGKLQGETEPEDVPVWYMSTQTDAPAIPSQALPVISQETSTPSEGVTTTSILTEAEFETPPISTSPRIDNGSPEGEPGLSGSPLAMLLAAGSALLLVSLAMGIHLGLRR